MGRGSSKLFGGGGGISVPNASEVQGRAAYNRLVNQTWVDSLSDEQKRAIVNYSTKTDDAINSALRNGGVGNYGEDIRLLDSAIASYDLQDNIIVYRGVDAKAFGVSSADKINENILGKALKSDNAFLSTSTDKFIAGDFLTDESQSVLLKITVPSGRGRGAYISSVSGKSSEREFLIKRNPTLIPHALSSEGNYKVVEVVMK